MFASNQRLPYATATESVSAGRPVRDSLSELAASAHTETDLCDLLRQMGGMDAIAPTNTELEGEEYEEAVVAKEYSNVPLYPAPVSSAALGGLSTFVVWDVQGGGVGGAHTCAVYTSLEDMSKKKGRAPLRSCSDGSWGIRGFCPVCQRSIWRSLALHCADMWDPSRDGGQKQREKNIRLGVQYCGRSGAAIDLVGSSMLGRARG